ncbi:MAG TPA: hypothetical protein VGN57_08825 [Pirellulaceae bacterium]|nr:hypothetical protein [Pirellulaceae bacterium]
MLRRLTRQIGAVVCVAAVLLAGCPSLFEEAIPPRPAPIATGPVVQAAPAIQPGVPTAVSTPEVATGQTQLSFAGLAGSSLRQFSSGLPTGRQNLDGVEFAFGDLFLQLRSSRRPGYPSFVRIPVSRPFAVAHFLHATQYGTPLAPIGAPPEEALHAGRFDHFDDTQVGEYVVVYRNGTERPIPLRYGNEIRDWWNWDERGAEGAATVWEIEDAKARELGISARLFQLTWTNPHPELEVATIEFRSAESIASPFCVAITVDGGYAGDAPATAVAAAPAAIPSSSTEADPSVSSGFVKRRSNSFRDSLEALWGGGTSETPDSAASAHSAIPASAPDSRNAVAAWAESLARLRTDRDRALADLVDHLRNDIRDARVRATLENRNEQVALLEADAAALQTDRFRAPKSPDVRTPAETYFQTTVSRENDFLVSLKSLDARRPAGLPTMNEAELRSEIAEVEASLAKLALAQRLLAAAPASRISRPAVAASVSAGPVEAGPAEFLGPAPIRWKVAVDPSATPAARGGRVTYRGIDGVRPEHMLYPSGPATFTQAGFGSDGLEGLRLIELRTGRTLSGTSFGGAVGPETGVTRGSALAPAGDRWSMLDDPSSHEFFLMDPRREGMNRPAATIRFRNDPPIILLPTSDRAVTIDAEERVVTSYSLPSGARNAEAELFATPSVLPGRFATSPGGRYLVVSDDSPRPTSARFIDLQSGEEVGALELPGREVVPHFIAFAFSHDGKEFAALMANVPPAEGVGPAREGIVVWDVASGRPTYARPIDGLLEPTNKRSDYPLQWFPDGRGWLAMQRFVIDREQGRVSQTLEGYSDSVYGQNGAKILNDSQILVAESASSLVVQEATRIAN